MDPYLLPETINMVSWEWDFMLDMNRHNYQLKKHTHTICEVNQSI